MSGLSFGGRVAEILNLLFGTKLTCWDVEFSVGRYPVRLTSLRHRIAIAEMWHNPQWDYEWLVRSLLRQMGTEDTVDSEWGILGVHIAVIFGIFGDASITGEGKPDVVVTGWDLIPAMAARYARDWGLPLGNIIICCREKSPLWELIHRGELRAGENIPGAERLIHACGGSGEVERYLFAMEREGAYCPSDTVLSRMRKGMYCSVIGDKRSRDTIPNVYKTYGYICGPDTALCYSGLQDCRAVTGESHPAIILSGRSLERDLEDIASIMGITREELETVIH